MKKLLAFVLAAVMVISVFPFSESLVAEAITKTVKSIEIVSNPEKTEYYYEIDGYWNYSYEYDETIDDSVDCSFFEYYIDRSGLEIKINYSDGSSVVADDEYYYDNSEITVTGQDYGEEWNLGVHKVTVSYMNKTAYYNISVVENPVESIEIVEMPDKLQYIKEVDGRFSNYYEDIFDEDGNYVDCQEKEFFVYWIETDGLTLKYNLTDGTSVVGDLSYFSDDYEENSQGYGETWDIGTHTVNLKVMGIDVEFDIEVVENPVESIQVVTLPEKLEYIENTDDGYFSTYSWYDSETDEYHEYEYYVYLINYTGLKIKVNYTDGTSKTLSNDEFFDGEYCVEVEGQDYGEIWDVGKHRATVTYMGRTASFEISVVGTPYSGIEFEELNLKDYYIKGEIPSLDGSKIKVKYKNGSSSVYTIEESDGYSWFSGEGTINGCYWYVGSDDYENGTDYTFNYLNFSLDFHINRKNLTVKAIELLSEPESYDGTGADVKITYSDNSFASTKILAFEARQGDCESGNIYEGGFVNTGVGVFPGCYQIINVFDTPNSSYRYCIGNSDFSDGSAIFETSSFKIVSVLYKADSLIDDFVAIQAYDPNINKVDGPVFYDAEFTEENIDTWTIVARSLTKYLVDDDETYRLKYTSDEMDTMLSALFDYDRLDLTKSQKYNVSTGIYTYDEGGGWGLGPRKITFETEHKDGFWYITRTETNDVGTFNHYLIMTEDGKCTYVGTVAKSAGKLGDINNDGSINSSDALKALQHSVGYINLTGDAFERGDVNKDSRINSTDALLILQFAVGKITEF